MGFALGAYKRKLELNGGTELALEKNRAKAIYSRNSKALN